MNAEELTLIMKEGEGLTVYKIDKNNLPLFLSSLGIYIKWKRTLEETIMVDVNEHRWKLIGKIKNVWYQYTTNLQEILFEQDKSARKLGYD